MKKNMSFDVNLASIPKPKGLLRRRSSNEMNLSSFAKQYEMSESKKALRGNIYTHKAKEFGKPLTHMQRMKRRTRRHGKRLTKAAFLVTFLIVSLFLAHFLLQLRCRNLCQWPADDITGDFFSSTPEIYQQQQSSKNEPFQLDFRNFLSKTVYRDMSDIIIHTDEFPESISEADSAMYRYTYRKQFYFLSKLFWSPCLSPVPLFYFFNDEYDASKQALHRFLSTINHFLYFNRPFMILSVSFPILPYSKHPELLPILNHPNCLKWFTTNVVEHHEKFIAIPLGVLMESPLKQAPLLAQAISETNVQKDVSKNYDVHKHRTNLVLVNFSTDNPIKIEYRQAPYDHFCHPTSEFHQQGKILCTKTGGFFDQSFKQNEEKLPWEKTALETYRVWSQFKYTVCPRGEKLDSYRIWESLYLGSIPIIQHSTNDASITNTFGFSTEEVPVLFVTDFEQITVELLEYLWEHRFRTMMESGKWRDNLSVERLRNTIKYVRDEEIKQWYFQPSDKRRARCWGGMQGRW